MQGTREHPDLGLIRHLSAVSPIQWTVNLGCKIVKLCHLNVVLMVDVKCDALYSSGVRRRSEDDTTKAGNV